MHLPEVMIIDQKFITGLLNSTVSPPTIAKIIIMLEDKNVEQEAEYRQQHLFSIYDFALVLRSLTQETALLPAGTKVRFLVYMGLSLFQLPVDS